MPLSCFVLGGWVLLEWRSPQPASLATGLRGSLRSRRQSVISPTSACHIFKTPPSPKRLIKVVPSARLHCLWGEANRVGREGGGDNSHPRPRQREVGPRGVRISPVSLRHRPKGPRVGRGAPRPFTVHPDGKRAGITPTDRAGSPLAAPP